MLGAGPSVAVLVVDDDPVMHRVVESALTRSARCELLVVHAASPEQALIALDAIPRGPRLVVLSDLEMDADMDGVVLLERVRERREDAIRLLYTANIRAAVEAHAEGLRLDGIYEKPLDVGAFTRAFWRTVGFSR